MKKNEDKNNQQKKNNKFHSLNKLTQKTKTSPKSLKKKRSNVTFNGSNTHQIR